MPKIIWPPDAELVAELKKYGFGYCEKKYSVCKSTLMDHARYARRRLGMHIKEPAKVSPISYDDDVAWLERVRSDELRQRVWVPRESNC